MADTLHAIYSDALLLQKAVTSERAAAKSLDITSKRMELGDINYLALLNAQQTYQQALLSVAQAEAARYADTVALFQALGGGWWQPLGRSAGTALIHRRYFPLKNVRNL